MSYNETARQGRFQTQPWVSYKVEFDCGAGKAAESLLWIYDAEYPAPGVFILEEGSR